MEPDRVDWIVERLRGGRSVALAGARSGSPPRRVVEAVERELRELGRTIAWIDLAGAESGADLGGRIVEGCLPHLDPDDLGDLLEQLPSHGRIDLEAFAELLMLPERIAAARGRRVVAILEGFHQVERAIGFAALGAVRDALLVPERASYLFVGARRLEALFGRPDMPLYGLAEVVVADEGAGGRATADRRDRAGRRRPGADAPGASETGPAPGDPLAAALLQWAEAPPEPKPEPEREREPWEWLLARDAAERAWLERLERGDDEPWRRGRRRRR